LVWGVDMSVGYDKHSLNHQLVLDLPFEEMTGLVTYCRAQSNIVATLRGGPPTWQQFINGLQYLDFVPGTLDFLDAPGAASAGLDFTTGDFSVAVWARVDDLSANRMLLCRGLLNVDGWHCAILMNGSFVLYTNQGAGTNQSSLSAAGEVVVATWYLLGFTRVGGSVRCYKNGRDVTNTVGVHLDLTTSARELHIGIYDPENASPFDGGMHRPRVWSRALSAREHMELYNMESQMFP